MRMLFTSQPMYGHVNTVLPQALAARDAGHEVVFATGASMAPTSRAQGLDVWTVGPDSVPRGNEVDWIGFFVSSAHDRVDPCCGWLVTWRPDIGDPG